MYPLFRFLLATIILLPCFCIKLNAQTNRKEKSLPAITLRTNPFSFLETDGNAMLGLGIQWHPQWAFTIDPGYIFFSAYQNADNDMPDKLSGIKIRSDIRFFFERSRKGMFNTFIAPEFHYKYVTAKKWDQFGINCLGGQCDYYQQAQYKEVKEETGASLKLGTLLPLWGNRFDAELYGGIGFKFKKFRETDIPIGGSFVEEPNRDNVFNNNREGVAYLILPVGIKLVFRLR